VRVLADGQTHRQTDRQTQTDFIICPMLYAIAMGQITRYRYKFCVYSRVFGVGDFKYAIQNFKGVAMATKFGQK